MKTARSEELIALVKSGFMNYGVANKRRSKTAWEVHREEAGPEQYKSEIRDDSRRFIDKNPLQPETEHITCINTERDARDNFIMPGHLRASIITMLNLFSTRTAVETLLRSH